MIITSKNGRTLNIIGGYQAVQLNLRGAEQIFLYFLT